MSKSAVPRTFPFSTWVARARSFASPNALRAASTAFSHPWTSSGVWATARLARLAESRRTGTHRGRTSLNMGERVDDRHARSPARREERGEGHRREHGDQPGHVREKVEVDVQG